MGVREPIFFKGEFLVLPSYELAKEEKRMFFLALSPEVLAREQRRELEVWEIRCDDERVFKDGAVTAGFKLYYSIRFWRVMYLLGFRDDPEVCYDGVKKKIEEELLGDPGWIEVWERMRIVRSDPEWWEKVRGKFSALNRDELLVSGRKMADMRFMHVIEGTYEEFEGKDNPQEWEEWGLTFRMALPILNQIRDEMGEDAYKWVRKMIDFDAQVVVAWRESTGIVVVDKA